jgi:hypothetical protein
VSTFSLNGYPIVVLFDSSATPKAYIQKYRLAIAHTHTPYMTSTLGGNIITKQVILSICLNLAGKLYKASLIVLDGQGIDVILGMSWMKEHKALLDTATTTAQLSTLDHGIVTLQLSTSTTTAPSVQYTTAQNLEDILMACEFPDDWPGMPLDREVEFIIELQPDTAPISR